MATPVETYVNRTATRVLPRQAPSGPAPGAIIGEAVANLGEAGSNYLHKEDELRLSQARSDNMVRFAQMQARVAAGVQDLRGNAQPGAVGHEDGVAKLADTETQQFMDGVKDPRLIREFGDDVARWRAGLSVSEHGFAIERRATKQVSDHATALDLKANELRTKPDGNDLGIALDQFDKLIDGYVLPADVKEKLRTDARQRLSRSYLEGLPADQRLAVLEKGAFDKYLEPQTKDTLITEAGSEIRSAASAARQQANQAKAEAKDQVEGVARLIRDGVPIPDSDVEGAQKLAQANGLDALSYELGTARVKNRLTRETSAWMPADYDKQLVDLNAKIAAGGDHPDPALVIQRDHLETLRTQRLSQLREHPVEWLASNGVQLDPIDFNDPATLAPDRLEKRARTMRALSAQAGTPLRILTDTEAAPLVQAVRSGSVQRRTEAAMAIGAFGRNAEAILQQVAPQDAAFQIAARLGTLPDSLARSAMQDVLSGPDALKANPKLYDKQRAEDAFNDVIGDALARLPTTYRAGLLETARNLYATRHARAGGESWSEDGFKGAIGDAIGGYWKQGKYLGGVIDFEAEGRSHKVLLPIGMSADEFHKRLARSATADFAAAGNGAPTWNGGSRISADELRAMLPVAVGDGSYWLKSGNGFITLGDRQTLYRLDVRRLGTGAR